MSEATESPRECPTCGSKKVELLGKYKTLLGAGGAVGLGTAAVGVTAAAAPAVIGGAAIAAAIGRKAKCKKCGHEFRVRGITPFLE